MGEGFSRKSTVGQVTNGRFHAMSNMSEAPDLPGN